MRVLVSGVTGLVGKSLSASLNARGDRVLGLSRDPRSARKLVPALHDAYAWPDPTGAPPDEALLETDAVVHLAGEPVVGRWTSEKRRAIEESRVLGTRSIVQAIERAKPRPRVLGSASAMGYYGSRGDDVLREDEPAGDDFLARVCAGWEREALAAEALGVRVVCLRISLVLAREGGALDAMRRVFGFGLGGRMGAGTQWWSWIHLEDLIGLILFGLDHDALRGPVNASAPGVVSQSEFAKTLARVMRRPALMPTPAFALKLAMSGFAEELLASRRLSPARALEAGYGFRFETLEPALRDLL